MDQMFVVTLLLYATAFFLSASKRGGWVGPALALLVGIVMGRPAWEIVTAVGLAVLIWRRNDLARLTGAGARARRPQEKP